MIVACVCVCVKVCEMKNLTEERKNVGTGFSDFDFNGKTAYVIVQRSFGDWNKSELVLNMTLVKKRFIKTKAWLF